MQFWVVDQPQRTWSLIAVLIAASLSGCGSRTAEQPPTTVTVIETTTATPSPATPDTSTAAWVGTWRGAVHGDTSEYDVEVVLTATGDGLRGTVAYPQLECGGNWVQTRQFGSTREFTETITYQGTCIEVGRVQLTHDGDALSYEYTSSTTKDITATLTRVAASPDVMR